MTHATRYFAVILAAGSGKRFSTQALKQYECIAGKTVLEHSIERICTSVKPAECVLVHAEGDNLIKQQRSAFPVRYVQGGSERMFSVLNALHALFSLSDTPKPNDYVLIHDAARPCVRHQDMEALIQQTTDHPVGGILATPVSSTVKKVDDDRIHSTIPRSDLWLAQTPQLLRIGLLKNALEDAIKNDHMVTDDASALEIQGHFPLVVRGSASNIKITYPDDLALATFYLSRSSCDD